MNKLLVYSGVTYQLENATSWPNEINEKRSLTLRPQTWLLHVI